MNNNLMFFLFYLICFAAAKPTNAAIFDWLWRNNQNSDAKDTVVNGPLIAVPFESKTDDDKFLEEASKLTNLIKSSALDLCQHKVVLSIKTSCADMTEEELAKMSVHLLNCQSAVDGRQTFPCAGSMSLRECTIKMDANMWNAYHMMNNRARAVCLTARRSQFHALSEMTVNKLMSTAHEQINKMVSLQQGQERLETLTSGTLASVQQGNIALMEQQNKLRATQQGIQDFISFNLQELTREKALIAAGHKELSRMTQGIKEKLDEANQQLVIQSLERSGNHQQLLQDIEAVQKQAQDIFHKIDLSTERLLAQHHAASLQYQETIDNLKKINTTVNYLLGLLNATRSEIDERFLWIQQFLGGTGEDVSKIFNVVLHLTYLLLGMLFASFLNFSAIARSALAVIVPLNLVVTYNQGPEVALDFPQMTVVLVLTTLMSALVNSVTSYLHPKHQILYIKENPARTLGIGSAEGEKEVPASKTRGKSSVSSRLQLQSTYNFFRILISKVNQFASTLINGPGSPAVKSASPATPAHDETMVSSTEDRDWRNATPVRQRNTSVSSHHFVSEWLQSKTNFVPPPLSTSSRTSGSAKLHCSAFCRSGRRCRNVSSPGRELCHRHLGGTSIAS